MDKQDYYSVYVGAYCLDNNKALQSLDVNLIPNQDVKDIITIAKELDIEGDRITRGLLVGSLNPGMNHTMDHLYQFAEESLRTRKLEEINTEYIDIKNILQEAIQRGEFAKELGKLAHMVNQGKISEVNQTLWNMRYDEPVSVETTMSYMIDSIQETSGFKTGIASLDEQTGGLSKGNLMGIIGDSGHYKTMVSTWIILKILEHNPNFHACYFEKEMPVKDLAVRLVSYFMRIEQKTIREFETDSERENFGDALIHKLAFDEKMKDIVDRFHIIPNTSFEGTADMVDYIKYFNAQVWCLDFLTMLESKVSSEDAKNAHIEKETTMMKHLCDKTNSLGIVLAQLKQNTVELRKNKIPERLDIEYGKKLKQYAAYMFATFMPSAYYTEDLVPNDYYYLVGMKNRFSKPFNIPLKAVPMYCDFEEPYEDKQAMERWLNDYRKQFKN